jgi:hypothetical protein
MPVSLHPQMALRHAFAQAMFRTQVESMRRSLLTIRSYGSINFKSLHSLMNALETTRLSHVHVRSRHGNDYTNAERPTGESKDENSGQQLTARKFEGNAGRLLAGLLPSKRRSTAS